MLLHLFPLRLFQQLCLFQNYLDLISFFLFPVKEDRDDFKRQWSWSWCRRWRFCPYSNSDADGGTNGRDAKEKDGIQKEKGSRQDIDKAVFKAVGKAASASGHQGLCQTPQA